MPTRIALLDTNAMIRISAADLAAATEMGWRLTTSPWSFFERLRHLSDKNFGEARANLLKFQRVEIIDKPLDRLIAKRQGDSGPRVWGSELAREALSKIPAVNSLEGFKGLTMKDAAGEARALESSVGTISSILEREKKKFQKLVTDIIRLIKSGRVPVATAAERHQAVLDMLVAGESSFRDTEGLDYEKHATKEEILTFEYVYYAYVVMCSIRQHGLGGSTCAKNDFVDGQICAYVPLDQNAWVITADGPLNEVLFQTKSLLTEVGMEDRAAFVSAHPDSLRQGGQP